MDTAHALEPDLSRAKRLGMLRKRCIRGIIIVFMMRIMTMMFVMMMMIPMSRHILF